MSTPQYNDSHHPQCVAHARDHPAQVVLQSRDVATSLLRARLSRKHSQLPTRGDKWERKICAVVRKNRAERIQPRLSRPTLNGASVRSHALIMGMAVTPAFNLRLAYL